VIQNLISVCNFGFFFLQNVRVLEKEDISLKVSSDHFSVVAPSPGAPLRPSPMHSTLAPT